MLCCSRRTSARPPAEAEADWSMFLHTPHNHGHRFQATEISTKYESHLSWKFVAWFILVLNDEIKSFKWRFREMGVPPNHLFIEIIVEIFHFFRHPAMGVPPADYGNPPGAVKISSKKRLAR